nr:hypothetical protein GCM10017611_59420 [Rhodococcus wratislaviensis]
MLNKVDYWLVGDPYLRVICCRTNQDGTVGVSTSISSGAIGVCSLSVERADHWSFAHGGPLQVGGRVCVERRNPMRMYSSRAGEDGGADPAGVGSVASSVRRTASYSSNEMAVQGHGNPRY